MGVWEGGNKYSQEKGRRNKRRGVSKTVLRLLIIKNEATLAQSKKDFIDLPASLPFCFQEFFSGIKSFSGSRGDEMIEASKQTRHKINNRASDCSSESQSEDLLSCGSWTS